MSEMLQRWLGDLAQAKVLADADLPFIMELETMVIGKLRDPMTKMQEQGILPPGGGQQPGYVGEGVPVGGGVMQGGGAMPNPDELRRMLSQ